MVVAHLLSFVVVVVAVAETQIAMTSVSSSALRSSSLRAVEHQRCPRRG
jgi:hypothetical protein